MQFKISRTSTYDSKPCEEAIKKSCFRIDTRTVSDPAKLRYFPDNRDWYKLGKNHRVENGHIKRDFDDIAWFIEINTLEELITFEQKYGRLVIEKDGYDFEIEIYDDYRE